MELHRVTTKNGLTHLEINVETAAGDLNLLGRLVNVQLLVGLNINTSQHGGDHNASVLRVELHQAGAGVDRDYLERSGLGPPRVRYPRARIYVAAEDLGDGNLGRRNKLQ